MKCFRVNFWVFSLRVDVPGVFFYSRFYQCWPAWSTDLLAVSTGRLASKRFSQQLKYREDTEVTAFNWVAVFFQFSSTDRPWREKLREKNAQVVCEIYAHDHAWHNLILFVSFYAGIMRLVCTQYLSLSCGLDPREKENGKRKRKKLKYFANKQMKTLPNNFE